LLVVESLSGSLLAIISVITSYEPSSITMASKVISNLFPLGTVKLFQIIRLLVLLNVPPLLIVFGFIVYPSGIILLIETPVASEEPLELLLNTMMVKVAISPLLAIRGETFEESSKSAPPLKVISTVSVEGVHIPLDTVHSKI